jgi:hypothetical protein
LQGHRLIGTTLANEDFAAADDERSRYKPQGRPIGSTRGVAF